MISIQVGLSVVSWGGVWKYEMSVSDWSSDVCSSDLGCEVIRINKRVFGGTPKNDFSVEFPYEAFLLISV